MLNEISIQKFEIISTIFIMILGTLLHFTYEWSNNNIIVGTFSAINESTWEHLKLVFFPMLITTIIGFYYFKDTIPNYLCAKTIGIIIAMTFIVVFFYTYTGIIGRNFAVLDIGSFFIAILLSQYLVMKIINEQCYCNNNACGIILGILLVCFIVFTFKPPQIALFKDPVTNTFGIYNKNT